MAGSLTQTEPKCYHCGISCKEDRTLKNDKHFCCFGCETVYQILKDHDLICYYDLEVNPGLTMNTKSEASNFDFLDNPDIENQLLEFNGDKLKKITFSIPSIHCSSCIWLLENLSTFDSGIISSTINFGKKELSLSLTPAKISTRKAAQMLSQLGYPPLINLDSTTTSKKSDNSSLFLKLGIAGFCFGNIMLFSFPNYLGATIENVLQHYFSYLSFILVLPVIFYSGQDYFRAAYKGIRKRQVNIDIPIALGITTLFLRSSYEVLSQTGPGYFDSLSALVFFLLIGKWFQSRTYEGLSFDRDYRSYFPIAVLRVNKEDVKSTPVYQLKENDHIRIRNHEIIPTDSIAINSKVRIDYSFVTGEAKPVVIDKGQKVFAGGRLVGQAADFMVQKKVSQSYLTQLWNDTDQEDQLVQGSRPLIDQISRYFTFTILLIAFGSAIVWMNYDVGQSFLVFTAVLIVACPCALALATPFTLSTTMNILGRNNFYLKNTHAIEKIWAIDHLVFDKTGTLTTNNNKQVEYHGQPLSQDETEALAGILGNSVHPYSQIINAYLNIPKANELKIVSFKETIGMGLEGRTNHLDIRAGSLKFIQTSSCPPQSHQVSSGKVFVSINGQYKGYFYLASQLRNGIRPALASLQHSYKLSLLSGDNRDDESLLKEIFPPNSTFHFNQKPDHKANFIKSNQSKGQKIMMLGDGLNDAIALKESHVGIAVTEDMSAFTPASDIITHGDSLSNLSQFIDFVMDSKKVIVAGFTISFLYNVIGLGFAVTGHLTAVFAAILMPLSSISVVVFSTSMVKLIARKKHLI